MVSQTIGLVNKIKQNLFQIKRKSSSFSIDQEPKITKRKLKNLHISFDPKLLEIE